MWSWNFGDTWPGGRWCFKCVFYFLPILFDDNVFQISWNRQLPSFFTACCAFLPESWMRMIRCAETIWHWHCFEIEKSWRSIVETRNFFHRFTKSLWRYLVQILKIVELFFLCVSSHIALKHLGFLIFTFSVQSCFFLTCTIELFYRGTQTGTGTGCFLHGKSWHQHKVAMSKKVRFEVTKFENPLWVFSAFAMSWLWRSGGQPKDWLPKRKCLSCFRFCCGCFFCWRRLNSSRP